MVSVFISTLKIFAHLFPSPIKVFLLRALGYKIGKNTYLGYSLILSRKVEIGNNVSIGHFNLIKSFKLITLENGCRIGSFNWITGGGIGYLLLGYNASIRRFHFIEASGGFSIGNNSILAGRGSHFFTHGLSPNNLDDVRPILISDWCYIGTSVRFVPGVIIPEGCFVGMGSVVTKSFTKEYSLIAGSPATIKKTFTKDEKYFNRPFLKHAHHPHNYDGKGKC